MTWKPSHLSREQMEERRLEGGRLLRQGKLSQAEIARRLDVSRATVSDWAKIVKAKGIRGLRKRKAPGSASKLSKSQRSELKRMLERGAMACGFPTDRWISERIRQLIEREFRVGYHPNYINRLLRSLGFSRQRPLPQAIEQDQELVEAWLEKDWSRIKKVAAARRKHRVLG